MSVTFRVEQAALVQVQGIFYAMRLSQALRSESTPRVFPTGRGRRRAHWVDSREWIVDEKEGSLSTINYPPSTKKAFRFPQRRGLGKAATT
jgi:hypothetical protein